MQLVQGYSHTLPRAKLSAAPPVNAPTCGCHYNHHEGFTNFMHPNEEWIFEKEDKFKQPGERYRSREPGQLVWYIGYLLVLLLQARKKDLPAVGLRSLSDSQVTHEIHTDLSSFPFMFI